ncbi:MAG: DUF5696 domain-containing protein, partial [Clostridiales bacterium]|nr:DUF5696 domain-containing protein [Clostridiales bacterium]
MNISAQTKRRWRNRIIFVAVVTAAIVAYVIYINSYDIYDSSHLTVVQNFGESRSFVALAGSDVDGMSLAAQNEFLRLYINESDTSIAVYDLRNNYTWYSTPPGFNEDSIANLTARNAMRSHVAFNFFNEFRQRTRSPWMLYPDSVEYEQFEIFSIDNGVRIQYVVGNLDKGIDALPFFIEEEYFEERIMANIAPGSDTRFMIDRWFPSEDMPGFMQMTDGIRTSVIHTDNMLRIFEEIGWTYDDTIAANEISGMESELTFNIFDLTVEFILDEDRLIANLPLAQFKTETLAQPFNLDFMKFFGAGDDKAEGFMLVPSGSGGIINFNNGRHREVPFASSVYGTDTLTNPLRFEVVQPVRLPIFGIQNNGAAVLAHIENG